MQEYEVLRAEILADYSGIRAYENMLYTVVAAILVFTLQSDLYFLCMIPYVVIMPVFFIVMSTKNGICKIATYMQVFLEGDNYNWETRQYYFDETKTFSKDSPLKWRTHSQYYLLSLTCSAATIYKVFVCDYTPAGKWLRIAAISVVTLVIFVIIYCNTFDYSSEKRTMIAHWVKVKNDLTSVRKK